MAAYRNPIQRSVITGCLFFIALLSVSLALQSYIAFSRSLYARYDEHLTNVLEHVEHSADLDDLRRCIETRVPSEKYGRLQQQVNRMVDDFGLTYLYICIPVDDGQGTMLSVCASTSAAERAAGDTEDWPLMYDESYAYTPQQVVPYLDAWENSPDASTFESNSDWGQCYTMCKPLVAGDGETLALLCADISIDSLHQTVDGFVGYNMLLTALTGAILSIVLIFWLHRQVIGPILTLERGTQRVMRAQNEAQELGLLASEASAIRTGNELESLADTIAQMSREMKSFVEEAEARAQSAEEEVEDMARVAYRDPLTHVKNRAAFEMKEAELEVEIAAHRAEFAIIMLDLNNLKKINDSYGHENGNKYIVGGCMMLCAVCDHSPVYRIGGDEFVAVLQGRDYADRDKLFETLKQQFAEAREKTGCDPWERYSAAAGMATFDGASDKSVQQVFRRADEAMYRNKRLMKQGRDADTG